MPRAAVVHTVAALALALIVGCFGAPGYRGPKSAHFDGTHFRNPDGAKSGGFWGLLGWQLTAEEGFWLDRIDAAPGPPPPRRVGRGELRVTFVNHATTLIQMDGLNILTDPIWSTRASPLGWVGPRRVRPPGLRFEDLPPIDLVLISHNHYDHLDLPTLRRVARAHRPRVLTGLGNAQLLRRAGLDARDLDWWDAAPVAGAGADAVTVTAVPAQHFSGRGATDEGKTLWVGFVVTGPAGAVYFAGDTGYGPHFAAIRARFAPIRLAVLPIGAYEPRWFMKPIHLNPEEALRAHHDLGARTSLAMHFGTFNLADDGQWEAPERLLAALDEETPRARFWILGFGEGRDVP